MNEEDYKRKIKIYSQCWADTEIPGIVCSNPGLEPIGLCEKHAREILPKYTVKGDDIKN